MRIHLHEETETLKQDALESELSIAGARGRFQSLVEQSPRDRPPSAAGTIRAFMRNDDQIFSALVAPIYEQETGQVLTRELYDVMMKEPVWPLYLGGYGYAVHHRSIKRDCYSKGKNAGGFDLGQAVYLRLIDRFITNDYAQYRALRLLGTFAHAADYRVEVLTYEAFRHRRCRSGESVFEARSVCRTRSRAVCVGSLGVANCEDVGPSG